MADARPKPERSPSRCHIITYDKISDERRIASGSFGVVYEAQHEDWGQVAIKKPIRITSITDKERCELEAEAAKMVDVRSLNIVTLFGVVIDPSHYCLVLEYMCHGSMKTFQSKFDNPWPMKICMIYNIVLGMNYLHETANIVHRDLKVDNVLVGEGFKAKISDFGLATWKKYTQKYSIMNCIESTCSYMGTTSHIPPENLRDVNKAADYKFDVYSFAVTLWEIVTNETPYKNAQNHEHLMGAVMHGQRPDIKLIPPECLDVIRNVMEACWDDDPQKRPSFGDLKKKIEICKKENEDAILDALGYLNKQLRDSPKISHTSLPSAKFVNDNNCNGVDRIDQRSNNGAMFTMVEQDNLKNTSTSDYSKKKTNGAMTNGTVTNVRRDTNDTHCHYKDKSTQHEINNISNSFPVLFKEVAATIESHTLGLSEEELKRVLENAHRDDMINEWEINQDSHIFTIRGDLRQMNDIHFKLQEIVQSENPSTTCSLSNASELDTMHTKNLSSTPVRDKRVEQSIQKSPIKGHRGDNLPKLLMMSLQSKKSMLTKNF
ncbi:receptor-interacting serine/threonine-protein kinase 2-like [Saccoglossus kowalevskii]